MANITATKYFSLPRSSYANFYLLNIKEEVPSWCDRLQILNSSKNTTGTNKFRHIDSATRAQSINRRIAISSANAEPSSTESRTTSASFLDNTQSHGNERRIIRCIWRVTWRTRLPLVTRPEYLIYSIREQKFSRHAGYYIPCFRSTRHSCRLSATALLSRFRTSRAIAHRAPARLFRFIFLVAREHLSWTSEFFRQELFLLFPFSPICSKYPHANERTPAETLRTNISTIVSYLKK